jgi:hypothetical protein
VKRALKEKYFREWIDQTTGKVFERYRFHEHGRRIVVPVKRIEKERPGTEADFVITPQEEIIAYAKVFPEFPGVFLFCRLFSISSFLSLLVCNVFFF